MSLIFNSDSTNRPTLIFVLAAFAKTDETIVDVTPAMVVVDVTGSDSISRLRDKYAKPVIHHILIYSVDRSYEFARLRVY